MDQNKENMTAKTEIVESDGSTRRTFIRFTCMERHWLCLRSLLQSQQKLLAMQLL